MVVLEELVASGPPVLEGGQSYLAGTLEVRLERDARLELASLQELPATTVAFQHRNAIVGEGATLHWALAQLGSRLVRSRVDNRLEGDRSSVEQVEIATLEWVDWYNHRRLHGAAGDIPPAELEDAHYRQHRPHTEPVHSSP